MVPFRFDRTHVVGRLFNAYFMDSHNYRMENASNIVYGRDCIKYLFIILFDGSRAIGSHFVGCTENPFNRSSVIYSSRNEELRLIATEHCASLFVFLSNYIFLFTSFALSSRKTHTDLRIFSLA